MNHTILKTVILDQHVVIQNSVISPRTYSFEENGNYILVGLRRAGKSTLLYQRVRDLVAGGVDWTQIIYINFEDERLSEFSMNDFQDIVEVQSELSEKPGYYFFDEIQNVDGWEKFVRRLRDSGARVFVTGSNAKMLSSEMERTLGGRLLSRHVYPYSFTEYLDALGIPHKETDMLRTKSYGAINRAFLSFYQDGGFPESLLYTNKRTYVESVYQKTLLGDIIARNGIRNEQAMRILMKKIAETVRNSVSFTNLYGAVKAVGFKVSKDSIIEYVSYASDAFLLFSLNNAAARFAEAQGSPKYYFADNGILNLFLVDKTSALLENQVAICLHRLFGDSLHFLKSSQSDIDLDFYIPDAGLAVQAAISLTDAEARAREVRTLTKLAAKDPDIQRFVIVTLEEEETIDCDGISIEVLPAAKFLLEMEQKERLI